MSSTQAADRALSVRRLALTQAGPETAERRVPIEAPVAIEVNGIGYAVMMATPVDLADYAVGFMLAEGLVATAEEVAEVDARAVEGGWVVRVTLSGGTPEAVLFRARTRMSESGCGLCGMDSIAAVLRPLPRVTARIVVDAAAIARALDALGDHQPLGRATGAVHAAAFCAPAGTIRFAMEDVGRHNALDKLVGRLARLGIDAATGFILLSARCSFELVEKTVRAGCPLLVTISAPTSLAAERAEAAGLALVSLARRDSALVVCDPNGVVA